MVFLGPSVKVVHMHSRLPQLLHSPATLAASLALAASHQVLQPVRPECQLQHAANARQHTSLLNSFLQAERLTYLGVAIQGSSESLVGSHPPSLTSLARPPSPPSQPVSVHPRAFDGSTPTNPPVLCPPDPSRADPFDKSTDDSVPPLPAALTAAQQLADQLKVLLSGQLNEQCESLQVCVHIVSYLLLG